LPIGRFVPLGKAMQKYIKVLNGQIMHDISCFPIHSQRPMYGEKKQEVLLALAKMQEQSIYMDKTTKNMIWAK